MEHRHPTYRRQTVIAASEMLHALGHSGLSKFVLELGLPDQQVGQGSGLQARTTSLAKYALENPDVLSAEGEPITYEIVTRAIDIWKQGTRNNIGDKVRDDFSTALRRDGVELPEKPRASSLFLDLDEEKPAGAEPLPQELPVPSIFDAKTKLPKKVFIVHGHAGAEDKVARFLERLGFEAIILNEQVNRGMTVIEKLEAHSDVGYAVVILSADDFGGKIGQPQKDRARQNVILEWGYFAGKLGRANVTALKAGDIELPSDILGLVWQELDSHGAWKGKLAGELGAVGFTIDWARVHV